MIIAKFGGTSVNTAERIFTLCEIVGSELFRQPVVVVSAIRGVTDLLLSLPTLPKSQVKSQLQQLKDIHVNLTEELFDDKTLKDKVNLFINNKVSEIINFLKKKKVNKASLDKLVSYGEIMSSYLIANAFEARGIKAVSVVATNLIVTDRSFGSAEFLVEETNKNIKKVLLPIIRKGTVPVVTGFIGSTLKGETTTLGRGGSDYSASIIGFCLGASEIQIWTDVDGIFTADPRLVKKATPLETISFKEASELATFGARVLHPRTIRPAISAGIPVKVVNTLNPKNHGTLIKEKSSISGIVKAISFKRKTFSVNIYATEMLLQKGFLARIFKVFANHNISVDLVSVSEVSVSVTLDNMDHLESVKKELSEFSSVAVIQNLGMISLIGEGITSSTKTIRKIFDILDKEKILVRMVSLSASNINISIVVESSQVDQVVQALHNQLLLKQINQKLPRSGRIAS